MTPIERCQHLKDYWKNQYKEREAEYNQAKASYDYWSNELVKAEIAEKLANEKSRS